MQNFISCRFAWVGILFRRTKQSLDFFSVFIYFSENCLDMFFFIEFSLWKYLKRITFVSCYSIEYGKVIINIINCIINASIEMAFEPINILRINVVAFFIIHKPRIWTIIEYMIDYRRQDKCGKSQLIACLYLSG